MTPTPPAFLPPGAQLPLRGRPSLRTPARRARHPLHPPSYPITPTRVHATIQQPSNPSPRPVLRAAVAALAALSAAATLRTAVASAAASVASKPSSSVPVAAAVPSELRVARAQASSAALGVRRPKPAPAPASPRESAEPAAPAAGGHGLEGQSFAVAGSAALLASAVAVAVTHPIDTLKTLRQARDQGLPSASEGTSVSLGALYKGVFSNILKEAPNAAIYLGTYEVFKRMLLTMPFFAAVPLLAMCVAGMLGDAVGSVVRVPAEIINKRLQLGLSPSWGHAIRDSFLSPNGVEGTFASWAAVLWRDVPYGGLQIAGYEFVRLWLAGLGCTGLPFSIVAGAAAGLVAAVLTTPADVLVTRMSTQSPQCYLETKRYMSPSATFVRIINEEGPGALWSGAMHRGLFYMPMIGLFFAAYESFKYAILNPSIVTSASLGAVATSITALSLLLRAVLPFLRLLPRFSTRVKLPLHLAVVAINQFLRSRRATNSAPN